MYIYVHKHVIHMLMYRIHWIINILYVCMIYLPHFTCTVVFAASNPMILSALHLKTSPLTASIIVMVEVFPLVGSGDPLRNHVMLIGDVPFTTLQSIMTSYPLYTNTGVPILTLFLSFVITDGLGTRDPSSISGTSNICKNNNGPYSLLIRASYFYFVLRTRSICFHTIYRLQMALGV